MTEVANWKLTNLPKIKPIQFFVKKSYSKFTVFSVRNSCLKVRLFRQNIFNSRFKWVLLHLVIKLRGGNFSSAS